MSRTMDRTRWLLDVEAMFNANAKSVSPGVVAELARAAEMAPCPSCAAAVIANARHHGPPLTVPTFNVAYSRSESSPEHATHVPADHPDLVNAGEMRGKLRSIAVPILRSHRSLPSAEAELHVAMLWADGPLEHARDVPPAVDLLAMHDEHAAWWQSAVEATPPVVDAWW